jgi:hypothetical protein
MMKYLHHLLDFLMMIVPILELTEVIAFIPPEYLPYYMLSTVLLRRGLRLLEDYLAVKRTKKVVE